MKIFSVEYVENPLSNHTFKVRGICECDVLNPYWDNRPNDIPGYHWGGGLACKPCNDAASYEKNRAL